LKGKKSVLYDSAEWQWVEGLVGNNECDVVLTAERANTGDQHLQRDIECTKMGEKREGQVKRTKKR
jgi:hypothetical protein